MAVTATAAHVFVGDFFKFQHLTLGTVVGKVVKFYQKVNMFHSILTVEFVIRACPYKLSVNELFESVPKGF